MQRRTLIAAFGTYSAAALAGCLGAGDEEDEEPEDAGGNETDGGAGADEEDENEPESDDERDESEEEEEEGEDEESDETDDESEGGDEPVGVVDENPEELSGTGSATETVSLTDGLTLLDVDPVEDIEVRVVDADGDVWRTLAADLENWLGYVPIAVPAGEYDVEVETESEWSVTVHDPEFEAADAVAPPFAIEGSEPRYVGPIEFDGDTTVAIEYEGDELFVKALTLDGDVASPLVHHESSYEEEATVEHDGLGWLLAVGEGDYTIEVGAEESEESGESEDSGGSEA